MKTLHTLAEVKLLRRELKEQIKYQEQIIGLKNSELFASVKVVLTEMIIEKGLFLTINYLIKKMRHRK